MRVFDDSTNEVRLSACVVTTTSTSTAVVVSLAGDIDLSDAAAVRDLLVAAIEANPALLSVRLDALDFADSSALSALLVARRTARELNVPFEIVNPQPRVQRLFNATGLDEELSVRTE